MNAHEWFLYILGYLLGTAITWFIWVRPLRSALKEIQAHVRELKKVVDEG